MERGRVDAINLLKVQSECNFVWVGRDVSTATACAYDSGYISPPRRVAPRVVRRPELGVGWP